MLVKAFLLRAIDTLSFPTRHCGAPPTHLSCDLAAAGRTDHHLPGVFPPQSDGRMNAPPER